MVEASTFLSSPTLRVKSADAVISVTGIFTVTLTVLTTEGLSSDLTVIVASPSPTAVKLPFSSTVTTLVLSDVNLMFLFDALAGVIVTLILLVSFLLITISSLSSSMFVTGIFTVTVISSYFVGSSLDETVIFAVPSPIVVILPFSSILTTSSLSEK